MFPYSNTLKRTAVFTNSRVQRAVIRYNSVQYSITPYFITAVNCLGHRSVLNGIVVDGGEGGTDIRAEL